MVVEDISPPKCNFCGEKVSMMGGGGKRYPLKMQDGTKKVGVLCDECAPDETLK